jgi:hypothetical protein
VSRLTQAQPAQRRGTKARIALAGPTGSGKTWTALCIAKGLAPDGKHLVVDTERGTAKLYADDFTFTELDWQPPYDPTELAQVLMEAGKEYDVVIVDSLSHFWRGEGGTLDQVDAAKARKGSQGIGAWKEPGKAQELMVEAFLSTPAHVIACMRSKMEYLVEQDEKGKQRVTRLGLAPVQRDDIEYEFTLIGELDMEHRISITKSRCHPLADKLISKGRAEGVGTLLRKWLDEAAPDLEPTAQPPAEPDQEVLQVPASNGDNSWESMRERLAGLKGVGLLDRWYAECGLRGVTINAAAWAKLQLTTQKACQRIADEILAGKEALA